MSIYMISLEDYVMKEEYNNNWPFLKCHNKMEVWKKEIKPCLKWIGEWWHKQIFLSLIRAMHY